jgi:hypothetical protein
VTARKFPIRIPEIASTRANDSSAPRGDT